MEVENQFGICMVPPFNEGIFFRHDEILVNRTCDMLEVTCKTKKNYHSLFFSFRAKFWANSFQFSVPRS